MYESHYAPSVMPYGGIGGSLSPSGQTTPASTTVPVAPLTDATAEQTATKLRTAITVSGIAAIVGFGIGFWAKSR